MRHGAEQDALSTTQCCTPPLEKLKVNHILRQVTPRSEIEKHKKLYTEFKQTFKKMVVEYHESKSSKMPVFIIHDLINMLAQI